MNKNKNERTAEKMQVVFNIIFYAIKKHPPDPPLFDESSPEYVAMASSSSSLERSGTHNASPMMKERYGTVLACFCIACRLLKLKSIALVELFCWGLAVRYEKRSSDQCTACTRE